MDTWRWGAAVLVAAAAAPAAAQAQVKIDGDVAMPRTYSAAELAELATITVKGRTPPKQKVRSYTGPSVREIVDAAQPVYGEGARNGFLRTTLTVRGAGGRSLVVAFGELHPEYGAHNAALGLSRSGSAVPAAPAFAVDGDRFPGRLIKRVTRITVDVEAPAPIGPPTPGAITVVTGSDQKVLDRARTARIPRITYSTTTMADSGRVVRRGRGPRLARILRVAGLKPQLVGSVTAVADDGYAATVTPAEEFVGRQQLALVWTEDGEALTQPRLVVDGDVRASRWVGSVSSLVVRCSPGRDCRG